MTLSQTAGLSESYFNINPATVCSPVGFTLHDGILHPDLPRHLLFTVTLVTGLRYYTITKYLECAQNLAAWRSG